MHDRKDMVEEGNWQTGEQMRKGIRKNTKKHLKTFLKMNPENNKGVKNM